MIHNVIHIWPSDSNMSGAIQKEDGATNVATASDPQVATVNDDSVIVTIVINSLGLSCAVYQGTV